jgi:soluble lytic murein transglycosylase
MQVMPETARETAVRHGIPWDEHRYRTDPAYSRQLGTAYLGDNAYGGDEVLASASYNAGPGAVNKWIKKFGDPRKGEISDADFAKHIPYKETRDYVNRVVPNQNDRRIVLEVSGLPAGSKVVAKTQGKPVAVAHAMARTGP